MNIAKCYGYYCDKENMSCFVNCNNMYVNAFILKQIHDKVNKYNNLLDNETKNHIYNLRKNFQNKFMEICIEFENAFDKIFNDTINKMNVKKCYGYFFDRENMSCFVDCNNMYANAFILKQIHDKVNKFNDLLDNETENHIHNLRKDFQDKFMEICIEFENEYDKIILEIISK